MQTLTIPASQYDRTVGKLSEVMLYVLLGLFIAYGLYSNDKAPFFNNSVPCICPDDRRDRDRDNDRDGSRRGRGNLGDTTALPVVPSKK